ncbi:MAG: hypothetical protein LBU42_08120 [Prevotellaceae bacterium]|jgi:hypothetical protein|nr:hypothetical protein [Prevotellaceae bacterium]
MKTKLFFFAMFITVAAGAQVTNVEPLSANYTDKTVSFRVWWNAGSRDATHLSKVWVWVDYITVNSNNTTSGNSWTRALISGTPTASVGTVARESGNDKGFWLTGNASTQYSATVTVKLNITASKFNWCAYVSDYPPNAASLSGSVYTLKGTQPFVVNSGTISGNTFTGTILSLTDATGCPGGIGRDVPHNSGTCLPHLTAAGSNCRDLVADDASTFTGCGIEIKSSNQGTLTSYGGENYLCPAGWRYPNDEEGLCMCTNINKLGFVDDGPYRHEFILASSTLSYPRFVSYAPSCYPYARTDQTWASFRGENGHIKVRCVRN